MSADVVELLRAYRRVRMAPAEQPPLMQMRSRGGRKRRGLRIAVLYLLDDHVRRRVNALDRELHSSALTEPVDPDVASRVAHAVASVRPVPYRRLAAAFFVTVCALVPQLIAALERLPEGTRPRETLSEAGRLMKPIAGDVLSLDYHRLPEHLQAVYNQGHARPVVLMVVLVALTVYAILRPLRSSFTLKRALLAGDVHPHVDVYRLEARAFGRAPRELPLDLMISAIPPLPWLYVGVYMAVAHTEAVDVPTGVAVAALATSRLAWLWRSWKRRSSTKPQTPNAQAPPARRPRTPDADRPLEATSRSSG